MKIRPFFCLFLTFRESGLHRIRFYDIVSEKFCRNRKPAAEFKQKENAGEEMLGKYLTVFFISMVPLVELRLAVPMAVGMGLPYMPSLIVCVIGNMLPVPLIYFFARKVLLWGENKPHIGKICRFFLVKGEKAGQKLTKKTGRYGLFLALTLFVGIPIPGTGAWTGTLAASFLNMGIKSTALAVSLGVILAGVIMAMASMGLFHIFGL